MCSQATRCRVDNGYNSHRGNPLAAGSAGSGCSDSGGDTSGSAGSAGSGSGSDRSHLSEEQFRCWEYMLEQNTQLLFDKELDTLSRAFSRRPAARGPLGALGALGQALGPPLRALSSSSPHLAVPAVPAAGAGAPMTAPVAPFLSRHFGSARSLSCSLTPASRRMGLSGLAKGGSSRQLLHTGPNAAYFGSLQRLMPYNLEYDFDVIHERAENGHSLGEAAYDARDTDSLEQDGRMRKYWDVATTEL